MKRNVLTAPVLKTVRWGLMCLALCLASMPANAADEMANTLVYAGENEDTINKRRKYRAVRCSELSGQRTLE